MNRIMLQTAVTIDFSPVFLILPDNTFQKLGQQGTWNSKRGSWDCCSKDWLNALPTYAGTILIHADLGRQLQDHHTLLLLPLSVGIKQTQRCVEDRCTQLSCQLALMAWSAPHTSVTCRATFRGTMTETWPRIDRLSKAGRGCCIRGMTLESLFS